METQTQTENFTLYDHAPTYTQPILFLNEDESAYTTVVKLQSNVMPSFTSGVKKSSISHRVIGTMSVCVAITILLV